MHIYTIKLTTNGAVTRTDFYDKVKAEEWGLKKLRGGAEKAILLEDGKKVREIRLKGD